MNLFVGMGRITSHLELKQTQSGIPVLSFCIAIDRKYQPDKENRQTDFINCVAWQNTAEFINSYFDKGRMILVEGELQVRKYEDKDGNKRTATEVVVERARFTGEKKQDGYTPANIPPEFTNVTSAVEDELPF